jgi:hypothetical protein
MGAYESHVDDPVSTVDLHDKPELVARDVENNMTVLQDARITEGPLDVSGCRPDRCLYRVVPYLELCLRLGTPRLGFPEPTQGALGDDPHGENHACSHGGSKAGIERDGFAASARLIIS